MTKKVSYVKMGDKYLVVNKQGKTEVFTSEEELNKYLNKNKTN